MTKSTVPKLQHKEIPTPEKPRVEPIVADPQAQALGEDIARTLGVERQSHLRRHFRRWIGLVALVLLALAITLLSRVDSPPLQFQTLEARRGDLTIRVSATGTLEPTNTVEVGSEISGLIAQVNVDYNDRVVRGQVLAELDTERLEAAVVQAEASLAAAEAALSEATARLVEQQPKTGRAEALREDDLISEQELEMAQGALERAEALRTSAEAQVVVARAKVEEVQTNLKKAWILSPIGGIVLERKVEPGQTVAASFQTPVLFTVAEDLTQMELHSDVDEADIGQVKEGQLATFTVDAYPGNFSAKVIKVYFAPQQVAGVVTYKTILAIDNSELFLRPGMTATVDIVVRSVEDALLVPNSALRFVPPEPEERRSEEDGGLLSLLLPRPPRSSLEAYQSIHEGQQRVWTLDNGEPVAIPVTIGATDGIVTEVLAGDITAGLPLIVDVVSRG